jgi:hypothetical protein
MHAVSCNAERKMEMKENEKERDKCRWRATPLVAAERMRVM